MTKWLILVNDPMCNTLAYGPYDTKEEASDDVSRWFDVAFDDAAEEKKAACDLTDDFIEIDDHYGTITLTLIEVSTF